MTKMDPSQDIVRIAKAAEHIFDTYRVSKKDISDMSIAYRALSDIVYVASSRNKK